MDAELSLAELLPAVTDLAAQAAVAVMDIYDSDDFDVQLKQDNSPVTAADLAANDIIIDGLYHLTPTIPIVSEESLALAGDRQDARFVWLVDPIDGTKEFIKRTGEFTVNIGLVRDGEPVLGVVAVPAQDTLYYGAAGLGAYKTVGGAEPQPIHVQPARDEPIVAVSSSHPSELTAQWMAERGLTRTQAAGSSLKFCLLAEGIIDVYPRLSPQTEWDTAAADAVLRAAGGETVEYETGAAMRYNKADLATPYYIAWGGTRL